MYLCITLEVVVIRGSNQSSSVCVHIFTFAISGSWEVYFLYINSPLGVVAKCFLALPPGQSWLVSRAELERNFSDVNLIASAATKVANIEQEPG